MKPISGPAMKPMALAPPMMPATAPCSCGATDNEAPEVNPGRAMPKPRPDSARPTTRAVRN